MNTKIVYVIASKEEDIYMEQAFVSAWSVRHYNPDCHIEMVCDQDTYSTFDFGNRAQYKYLFDRIHVRHFSSDQGMMERSRWMKTSLRMIIEGDFLFLDTDTVVCADLSSVDDFDFDLGMALDQNCEFDTFLNRDWTVKRTKRLYGVDVSTESKYFNSGVIYAKDNKTTHDVYKQWHDIWQSKKSEPEGLKDQSALFVANIQFNHIITEISGDYNCQVMASIQYLHTAKIMHYFNTLFVVSSGLNPFYGKSIFEHVKHNGITEKVKHDILNNKSLFSSPSMPVPREVALMWRQQNLNLQNGLFEQRIKSSNSYRIISFIWRHFPKIMHSIEWALGLLIRTYKAIK